MSISQKLENNYKNQIENIKNEKNHESKIKQIGDLILDVGKRNINAIAEVCNCSWKFAKKCYTIAKENLEIVSNKNKCGRKKKIVEYSELASDISKIVDEYSSTDPQFKTEKQYVRLTIKEIINRLIDTGKYRKGFISKSTLASLLNEMGYTLKK